MQKIRQIRFNADTLDTFTSSFGVKNLSATLRSLIPTYHSGAKILMTPELPKVRRSSISLSEEDSRMLDELAERNGMSPDKLINTILESELASSDANKHSLHAK